MLFDARKRDSTEPRHFREPSFEYFDRSASPYAALLRSFVNRWTSSYHPHHLGELLQRLKSSSQEQFDSACFELMLYAAFSKLGCHIEPHPHLQGIGSRPDFRITTPDGKSLLVEATMISGQTAAEKSQPQLVEQLCDEINKKLTVSDYFLCVDIVDCAPAMPRVSKLLVSLRTWLASLDYDKVTSTLRTGALGLPRLPWEQGGWKIRFEAIPKKPAARNEPDRPIGVLAFDGGHSASWKDICDTIKKKAKAYKEIDLPLVIALNIDSMGLTKDDQVQALFGQVIYRIAPRRTPPLVPQRLRNGAWLGRNGPHYRRVSAVWMFRCLRPWTVTDSTDCLYVNPWANNELPQVFAPFNSVNLHKGQLDWKSGASIFEVLGIEGSHEQRA